MNYWELFKKHWDKILIIALSFTPLLWFVKGAYIDAEDIDLWIKTSDRFETFSYFWNWKIDAGTKAVNPLWMLPYGFFWISLSSFLDFISVEKIWFCVLFGAQMGAFYLFFSEIFVLYKNQKYFKPVRFISTLYYNFNFFMVSGTLGTINTIQLSLIFLPLVLWLGLKLVRNQGSLKYYALFILIMTVFIPSIAQNPSLLALILFYALVFFFILIIAERKNITRKFFKRFILSVLIIFILNIWFILPYGFTILESNNSVEDVQISKDSGGFDFVSKKLSYSKIFHGFGEWTMFIMHNETTPYNSLTDYYEENYIKLMVFNTVILFFAFLPLVFYRKIKPAWIYYFFAVSLLISLELSLGSKSFLYRTFYDEVLWLFKASWRKFSHITFLSYPVLLGYGLFIYYSFIKKYSKIILLSSLILTLIVLSNGETMFGFLRYDKKQGDWPSRQVMLPNYWMETSRYLEEKKLDSRIFLFPIHDFYMVPYNWELGFFGTDVAERVINKSLIFSRSGGGYFTSPSEENINLSYNQFYQNNVENFLGLQKFLTTKTILQRNDYNTDIYKNPKTYPETVASILKSAKGISPDKNFGKLDVYSVDEKYFLPHFYTPKKTIASAGSVDRLTYWVSGEEFKTRPAIFLEDQNENKKIAYDKAKDISKEDGARNLPILEFRKINPTKYRVRVHSANGKFPLVFSETFHEGWKAYVVQVQSSKFKVQNGLKDYRILDGNEVDQANTDELKEYIQKGWVTTLGNNEEKEIEHKKWEDNRDEVDYIEKYSIDFVSRNFSDTIQNDNLPRGKIFETWFRAPIQEENHLTANGYANSWIVDTNEVCKAKSDEVDKENNCIKNPDGTYDFEMVVEFWPQRLFYVGLFISGSTLFVCLAYLVYGWRKRRKSEGSGFRIS